MIKDKRGFIAISVIYSFFVVFLMILLIISNTYYNNRTSFDLYKKNIKLKASTNYVFDTHQTRYLIDVVKEQINITKSLESGVDYDGSSYGSYRYFGKAPNNYVCFGKDMSRCTSNSKYLFRIVGVFKEANVKDGGGTSFVTKVVRANPLESPQRFNSSTSTNLWGNSSLKTYLNNTYLNDLSMSNFDERFQEKIILAKWYYPTFASTSITAPSSYSTEMTSSNMAVSQVGLISISDWGYASKQIGNCNPRSHYLDKYNSGLFYTCHLYNWLNNNQWFIDAYTTSTYGLTLDKSGDSSKENNLKYLSVTSTKPIYPAFYLASDIVVMSGTGTKADPYILNILAEGA